MRFLGTRSTKLESVVYHFVGNFKFLHENVKIYESGVLHVYCYTEH